MFLWSWSYERIPLDPNMKSTVCGFTLVITIRRTLEGRLGAKAACGRQCPQCHYYCCHYWEHSPGFIEHHWHVQPYCKEKLVSSHDLNQTGIKGIYWFISSTYLTCNQWTACSGLKSATHQTNHSTRHVQNVSKCLQISKHALIVQTFKTPAPAAWITQPMPWVWVQVPCVQTLL